MVSVLKYDAEEGTLTQSPYYVPTDVIAGNDLLFWLVNLLWIE